ncbi:MAG: SDR family oxidoreductase [Bacteroidales bacterium]
MKVLIIGNMGYVGPGVVARFRQKFPDADITGFDTGYFAHSLTDVKRLPESLLNRQIFGDVRHFPADLLNGMDVVVYLAAISNDPMGAQYEEVTLEVNWRSAVRIAEQSREKGVSKFVFASSCSMYGAADDQPKKETDSLNPLTAYARSKVFAERDLEPLAGDGFTVTCLRFATACGLSNRLRLDLVLNDFVAGAVTSGEINILSDGTPWRPLINVLDMAVAIEWASTRSPENGGAFLAVNTGSNRWNYQVRELAEAVASVVPGCKVSINENAEPDKRSYKVNFDLYEKLAPEHQPQFQLEQTINNLYEGLKRMNFGNRDFRNSQLIRLKVLEAHRSNGLLNDELIWIS